MNNWMTNWIKFSGNGNNYDMILINIVFLKLYCKVRQNIANRKMKFSGKKASPTLTIIDSVAKYCRMFQSIER